MNINKVFSGCKVMQLALNDFSINEAASHLGIGESTASAHLSVLMGEIRTANPTYTILKHATAWTVKANVPLFKHLFDIYLNEMPEECRYIKEAVRDLLSPEVTFTERMGETCKDYQCEEDDEEQHSPRLALALLEIDDLNSELEVVTGQLARYEAIIDRLMGA